MLTEVADGVWVRQSAWAWSNATVVRANRGLVLVDPGIDGSDLTELADDVDRLGVPVVAGFSTHVHWDHLLWHPRFGDVARYATPVGADAASHVRARAQQMAEDSAPGIPLELIGLLTPLPVDGSPVPGVLVEHEAHALGHVAILLAERGVLIAGDMLSDVMIPMLDPRREGQVDAYETALDRLDQAVRHVEVVIPRPWRGGKGDSSRGTSGCGSCLCRCPADRRRAGRSATRPGVAERPPPDECRAGQPLLRLRPGRACDPAIGGWRGVGRGHGRWGGSRAVVPDRSRR